MNRASNKVKIDEANLYLYDEIGIWGITATEFIDQLNQINADTIHLRVNSPGGDVFAARAMQTALKQHKAKIVAHVDGIAASAASTILMGADEIEMVDGGFIMIHKALSFFDVFGFFNDDHLEGLIKDMEKERELLAKVDDSIAGDYAKRTGKDLGEIKQKMTDETWFTAKDALDFGMINRIYDGEPVENSYDLSIFLNAPDKFKSNENGPTKREMEHALRDAGCSIKQAKAILAGGLQEEVSQRDVDDVEPEPQQRDVVEPEEKKKDKVAALLAKAEAMAPEN